MSIDLHGPRTTHGSRTGFVDGSVARAIAQSFGPVLKGASASLATRPVTRRSPRPHSLGRDSPCGCFQRLERVSKSPAWQVAGPLQSIIEPIPCDERPIAALVGETDVWAGFETHRSSRLYGSAVSRRSYRMTDHAGAALANTRHDFLACYKQRITQASRSWRQGFLGSLLPDADPALA